MRNTADMTQLAKFLKHHGVALATTAYKSQQQHWTSAAEIALDTSLGST